MDTLKSELRYLWGASATGAGSPTGLHEGFAMPLPDNLRGPWTFGGVIIAIIILAACLGVLYVALPAMGVMIPSWAVTIFWIVIIAFVAVAAIRLLLGM